MYETIRAALKDTHEKLGEVQEQIVELQDRSLPNRGFTSNADYDQLWSDIQLALGDIKVSMWPDSIRDAELHLLDQGEYKDAD